MQCECEATRTRSILNFLECWDNAIDDKSARTGLASSLLAVVNLCYFIQCSMFREMSCAMYKLSIPYALMVKRPGRNQRQSYRQFSIYAYFK